MNEVAEPRKKGRPAGRFFTHKVFTYLCDERYRKAKELALKRGQSITQLFRDLLDEAAKREGVE